MQKLLFLFCCVVFINSTTVSAQQNQQLKPSIISSFNLQKPTDSNTVSFRIPNSGQPLLFVFLSPECPLSKNYTLTLNKLFQQYKEQVQFYGCISGSAFNLEEINTFINTYKVLFPFVIDGNKKLTKYLAATVTPEVMLLSKDGNKVYSGAIDDWVQELGKQKVNVSKYYLQDAMAAFLAHKKVAIKKTTAYGCLINDY